MVSINTDGRVHASFIETFPGTDFPEIRFWPYYEGQRELAELRKALGIIKENIYKKNHNCQRYFKTLPLGRGSTISPATLTYGLTATTRHR